MGGLVETYGHNFRGSMYFHEENDGDRLEVRCGDVNISDWATMIRIGSTALAVLIAQTPLRDELPKLENHNRMYDSAKKFNNLKISPDGSLGYRDSLTEALNFQRHIARLACSDLVDYVGELDEDLTWTAFELLQYCNDFAKVLNNEADISILADRADWAAKIQIIHRDYAKRPHTTSEASHADLRAQTLDYLYDYIGITASDGRSGQPKYGYGYKLRDRGAFRYTTPDILVQKGIRQPPKGTRAAPRSRLIESRSVEKVSWSYVYYKSGDRLMRAQLTDLSSNKPTDTIHVLQSRAV